MTKLTFTEELTGWDVLLPMGQGVTYVMGRLEERPWGWQFLTYDGVHLELNSLDQIRHKLANLEQIRLNKLALQEMKDGND